MKKAKPRIYQYLWVVEKEWAARESDENRVLPQEMGESQEVAISQAPNKKMFPEGWSDQSCHFILRLYGKDCVGNHWFCRAGGLPVTLTMAVSS